MALLPIGTEVFSYLDHPFRISKGKIIEHCKFPSSMRNPPFRYRCEMYDPHKDNTMTESFFWVHLSEAEAKEAHDKIQEIFAKHQGWPLDFL
jgi:hypothetical protein